MKSDFYATSALGEKTICNGNTLEQNLLKAVVNCFEEDLKVFPIIE